MDMLDFNRKEKVSILTLAAWMILVFAVIGYLAYETLLWIVERNPG